MRLKDEDKQRRIRDAMVRLILREGIDGASVSKIAREAGVSPATIYVYYDSKEAMLSEVFRDCAHQSYRYLTERLSPDMSAGAAIEAVVRGYYDFSTEHEDVFSFVEQCSRCPTLASQVCEQDCSCDLFSSIHAYQRRGELRQCSDWTLGAMLFSPVRFLAMNRQAMAGESEAHLRELVELLQTLLLL